MKHYDDKNHRKVRTRFAPETRFDVPVPPAAPFRGTLENDLERLKASLLRELLAGARDAALHAPLRRATNDAAALAWTTAFPLLVLPELVREKAENARTYVRRQAALLKRARSRMGRAA